MRKTRGEFMHSSGALTAAAVMVTGIQIPASENNPITDPESIQRKWPKAPCRLCRTGCSVIVAVNDADGGEDQCSESAR